MPTTISTNDHLVEVLDKIESDIAWRAAFGERQLEITDLWSTYREDELEEIHQMLRGRGYRVVTFIGDNDAPVLLVYW